jgi:hypothetical protein
MLIDLTIKNYISILENLILQGLLSETGIFPDQKFQGYRYNLKLELSANLVHE